MQERAAGHSGKPDPEEEGKMAEPCGEVRGGTRKLGAQGVPGCWGGCPRPAGETLGRKPVRSVG